MSTFSENQVNRDEAGRFDFKASGPPASELEEPAAPRTISGRELKGIVASMVYERRRLIGRRAEVDDVIQRACLEIGRTYGFERIPLAPIRRVVSTVITKTRGHSGLGSTDRSAMVVFTQLRQDREEQVGRRLTGREKEVLAQKVRETWLDQRHKPSRNFLQKARLTDIAPIPHENDLVDGTSPWAASESHSADPSTEVGRAEEILNVPRSSWEARRHAWDALAKLREDDTGGRIPRVLKDTHPSKAVAWARATIDSYPGGVMGAVDRWGQAVEDEGTIALFAPFGDIDEDGRDAVCAMLTEYPQIADELWNSALSASTVRRAHRSKKSL